MPTGMSAVHYRYATVGGQRVFYREAGPRDAPAVVLLHGFPASSFMFRELIPWLAGRYHVIAPDHLGFGLSGAPPASEFSYTCISGGISFEPNLVDVTLDGTRLRLEPGQTVIPHGVDRDLTTDEIAPRS